MNEAVIIEAVRTPFGRRGGASLEFIEGHREIPQWFFEFIDARKIEDVIDGTVTLAGEQGANPARLAVLLSKLPVEVPGVSLNRMCGSSQQAVHFAAQAVAAGDMDYVVGCGVESMTRVPMFLDIGLGGPVNGFEKLDPELFKRHELIHQGESAERIAEMILFPETARMLRTSNRSPMLRAEERSGSVLATSPTAYTPV